MRVEADIVIAGRWPDRETIAVIEIRNQVGLSASDGADRTGYMRSTAGRTAPYYMLVSEDRGFLWHDGGEPVEFNMRPVIQRYLPNRGPERRLGPHVELIINAWIGNLVAGWRGADEEPERTLACTGFLDAVRGKEAITRVSA